jgi:hypothetical protein
MSITRKALRVGLAGLLLALEVATVLAPAAPVAHAQSMLRDYPIPGGWFYSQESRIPDLAPPFRGYTVVDDAEAAFWTGFRRFGGVEVLGYPVSRRYRYADGELYQAFQRGVLKWRAEQGAPSWPIFSANSPSRVWTNSWSWSASRRRRRAATSTSRLTPSGA